MDFEHTIYTKKEKTKQKKHGRMPQNVYEKFRWVEEEKHIQVEAKYYEMDVLSLMKHGTTVLMWQQPIIQTYLLAMNTR